LVYCKKQAVLGQYIEVGSVGEGTAL
jgi:hypothetical protein